MKNISVTDQHKRIIQMCQEGLKIESVARVLNISPNTVRSHKRTAYNRLNVKTNDEAWLKIKELECRTKM
jgi:DNA-binding NarL/FixJ family response regulator